MSKTLSAPLYEPPHSAHYKPRIPQETNTVQNKYEAAQVAHTNALKEKVLAQKACQIQQNHVIAAQKALENAMQIQQAMEKHLQETMDVESKASYAMKVALKAIDAEKHNKPKLQKEYLDLQAKVTLRFEEEKHDVRIREQPQNQNKQKLKQVFKKEEVIPEVKIDVKDQKQISNKCQEGSKVLETQKDFQKEKKSESKSPIEHCEEIFNRFKGAAIAAKPESYHRAVLMEAADKLKSANLDSITFSTEGNYSGGFKNGKKHGFGYKYVYERYYAGNSSCCDESKSWEVYIDGELVWSKQFYSGGW